MNKKGNVLILTKNLSLPGGVTNFYNIIKNKYDMMDIGIKFFFVGVNKNQDDITIIEDIIKYVKDLIQLLFYLKRNKDIKIVQLNPSFIPVPLIRGSSYIILSRLFGKKVICFFHGWDENFERRLMNNKFYKFLFNKIYNMSDLFFVLSEDFRSSLKKIGIKKNIRVVKTTFDGELFHISKKKTSVFRMVFLGRLQKEKGIFIILQALNELKLTNKNFKFSFIGWFSDKKNQKEFNEMVNSYNLTEFIELQGYLFGRQKIQSLIDSDVFVFPSYSEGCPTAVIEALAAGLFVISTNVGALKEIIKNGINGIIIQKDNYHDLKNSIEWCLENRNKVEELGKLNIEFAYNNFESKVIIDRFYADYKHLLGEKI